MNNYDFPDDADRCQAAIKKEPWNEHRQGRCGAFDSITINNKRLCARHGALEALHLLLVEGRAKTHRNRKALHKEGVSLAKSPD